MLNKSKDSIIVFLLIILAIVLVVGISIVSYSQSGSTVGLSDVNQSEIITIDGVNFNIPGGFEENVSERVDGSSEHISHGVYSMMSAQYYYGTDGKQLGVGVFSTSDSRFPMSSVLDDMVDETFYKKVIDGKDGWLSYDGTGYTFMYLEGEDVVVILASDEYLIEEAIV